MGGDLSLPSALHSLTLFQVTHQCPHLPSPISPWPRGSGPAEWPSTLSQVPVPLKMWQQVLWTWPHLPMSGPQFIHVSEGGEPGALCEVALAITQGSALCHTWGQEHWELCPTQWAQWVQCSWVPWGLWGPGRPVGRWKPAWGLCACHHPTEVWPVLL